MTVEQILKLIDAGFTKEEIGAMTAPGTVPAPEPAQAPGPAPAPDEKKPENQPSETNDVTEALKDIKQLLQKMNISGMTMATKDVRNTDDILASIINPPKGE